MEVSAEFVVAVLEFLSLVAGVSIYYLNSSNEQARSQREYLEKMMEKFLNNNVRNLAHKYDSPEGVDEYLKRGDASAGLVLDEGGGNGAIDELLFTIEHLLYLKSEGTIAKKEFAFFESDVRKIFSIASIQRYIVDYSGFDVIGVDCFRESKRYIAENEMWDEDIKKYSERFVNEKSKQQENDSLLEVREIGKSEFADPVIFIRINRYYKEGMSEDEIFDVVKGEWRINPDVAKNYPMVVAVAHGIVRGVFFVREWRRSQLPGCAGRWQFARDESRIATPQMKTWIGNSVKWMFPKGSANPIRYYHPAIEG